MEKIRITGMVAGKNIDLTVEATADGRKVGDFLADTYERLMERSPSMIEKLTKMVPGLVLLIEKFGKTIKKAAK